MGIARSTISEDERKNTSNVTDDNTCIPDLRYKIQPNDEEAIIKEIEAGAM